MVQPLEASQMEKYAALQQAEIRRRTRFLHASIPTQEKIVALLDKMSDLFIKKDKFAAQNYFF